MVVMCEESIAAKDSIVSAAIHKSDDTAPDDNNYPGPQCSSRDRIGSEGDKAGCREKGPRNAYERLLYGKGEGQVDPDTCQNQALETFYRGQCIVAESEMVMACMIVFVRSPCIACDEKSILIVSIGALGALLE